jgi:hypothetical protein
MTLASQPIALPYHYWRQRGCSAARALELARLDIAEETPRYPELPGNGLSGSSADQLRWVERPADIGLRFVGFADEMTERVIEHKGYFSEPNGLDGETYRGAVYQLPGRDGRAMYVAGYREGSIRCSGSWRDEDSGAARLDLRNIYRGEPDDGVHIPGTASLEAVMASDETAMRHAEREREYNEVWSNGAHFQRLGEAIATARTFAGELLGELRQLRSLRPAGAVHTPRVCATFRDKLAILRREITESRAERARILADHEHMRGTWRQRLWDAFADGADLAQSN